jgi:hypothetical protein
VQGCTVRCKPAPFAAPSIAGVRGSPQGRGEDRARCEASTWWLSSRPAPRSAGQSDSHDANRTARPVPAFLVTFAHWRAGAARQRAAGSGVGLPQSCQKVTARPQGEWKLALESKVKMDSRRRLTAKKSSPACGNDDRRKELDSGFAPRNGEQKTTALTKLTSNPSVNASACKTGPPANTLVVSNVSSRPARIVNTPPASRTITASAAMSRCLTSDSMTRSRLPRASRW